MVKSAKAISSRGRPRGLSAGPRLGRSARIIIGTLIVIAAGALQQTQLVVTGPDIPWPNVAIWAAAGWGLSGLSIRPMLMLALFGLVQDVLLNAPLGSFVLVNLAAFGAAAVLAGRGDREASDAVGLLYGLIAIVIGYIVMIILAVTTNDASPRLLPVFGDLGATLLLFMVMFPIFNLPASDDNMFRGR